MTLTLRDHVSAVRSISKLINDDNRITSRALASEIRNATLVLLKQQTDKGRLWQLPGLFTTLCLDLEPAGLSDCCSFIGVCNIRRSKPLPRIATGYQGPLAQVYSADGSRQFTFTSPVRYANILKLGLSCPPPCYWVSEDRLFISDKDIEKVVLTCFPEEPVPDSLYCKEYKRACSNPLDQPFSIPGFMQKQVIDLTLDRLYRYYFQRPPDGISQHP